MSLSSSLFSGISGLTNLGNAMQVIGDNIANVNTVGFKASSFTFQDLLSQSIATQSGTGQVGRGTALGDISFEFGQGSFETTGNTTDLAIGGEGFFMVSDPNNVENIFYTRAGNFRFDEDGFLTNPEGLITQGWALDGETGDNVGAVGNIELVSFSSDPEATSRLTVVSNLDADVLSTTQWVTNVWDGTETTPIESANYEYQTTVRVYDSVGGLHDITIYYDRLEGSNWEYMITTAPEEDLRTTVADTSGAGLLARGTVSFNDSGNVNDLDMSLFTGVVGNINGSAGVYNTNFDVTNMDAVTENGYGFELAYNGTTWALTNPPDGSYAAAAITGSGLNSIDIDLNGDTETDMTVTLTDSISAGYTFEFDINDPTAINVQNQRIVNSTYDGAAIDNSTLTVNDYTGLTRDFAGLTLTNDGGTGAISDGGWSLTPAGAGGIDDGVYDNVALIAAADNTSIGVDLDGDGIAEFQYDFTDAINNGDAAEIDFDIEGSTSWNQLTNSDISNNGYFEFLVDFQGVDGGTTVLPIELNLGSRWDGTQFVPETLTTTQFARSSSTIFQSSDGFGPGDLQSVDVSTDGIITGNYSNGQLTPLYRVALAKFVNNNGLKKLGGSLFAETLDSGQPTTNIPGEGGTGTISPNSLEQSNVDVAAEFVRMITTQRGFQANSKTITVVDQMLADVINMKR
ncbi:MAG: flagellar hook-basal body complex protein [Desulfobacterales bacterium]|nr:flagellar hook-basal body complex protein [Desulfobacterales bacterium]